MRYVSVNTVMDFMLLRPKNIIAIFFLLVILAGVFWYAAAEYEIFVLKREVARFITPSVVFDTKVYDVRQGIVTFKGEFVDRQTKEQVLRFARFSIESRLNPLFGIAGTDLDSFRKSIDALARSLEELAQFYDVGRVFVENNLYPIAFLNNLYEAEQLRRKLVATPSIEIIEQYHQKLVDTIDSHLAFVDDLQDALPEIISEKFRNSHFGFIGGGTSQKQFNSVLTNIKQQVQGQKETAKRRWECFVGSIRNCTKLDEHLSILIPNVVSLSKGPNEIPFFVERNENIIQTFRSNDSRKKSEEVSAHIVLIDDSRCFSGFSPTTYYYVWHATIDDGIGFITEYTNDIYFNDAQKTDAAYLNDIGKNVNRYIYQPVAMLYMCPDVAFDVARVATSYEVYTLLNTHPLFNTNDSTAILNKTTFEKEIGIRNGVIINEREIHTFIADIGELIREEGEVKLAGVIGEEKVLLLEYLLTLQHQRSSNFDKMVWVSIHSNSIIPALFRADTDIELPYLVLTRGYQATLLGLFNKSFIPVETPLLMGITNKTFPWMVSYNAQLSDEFTPLEIVEIMTATRAYERSLIREI